ncbi:oligopeptide/dipeptide ABC transporter ATP-binding protein [Microbacterium ulmi]|uniref:oligopeptide/dipeptide ABC transporter ATP-binding protein n=1 Tax=Microbacterium ulmi TaxID=179095 RepID=UPI001ABADE89|nr:peptide/nickel transport system ATP-binding protein [Microbacterium ulmi]
MAVDDVSLDVVEGEVLGIVGESGSGKSTLGRTMIGLQSPTAGRVRVGGVELDRRSRKGAEARRFGLQMVFQDPLGSLNPRLTVGRSLAEPLRNARMPRDRVRARTRDLLDDVGLPSNYADRYPHELSGGQQQRVAIARALATDPRAIVFDEAVSALDVSTQAQVVNLLIELREAKKLTYVFISHDIAIVNHISTRIAVMYLGRVVEIGEAAQLNRDGLHPYTVALRSAVPEVDPRLEAERRRILLDGPLPSPVDRPSGCRFHTRCPVAQLGRCSVDDPALLETAPGRWVACHFPGSLRPASGRP